MGAPADAIREFMLTLIDSGILAELRYIKDDIAGLRRVFLTDEDFAQALRAVATRLRNPDRRVGVELDHKLEGWQRIKFSSGVEPGADLRIIFRRTDAGLELRAFGHRHAPESVYRRALPRSH